MASPKKPSSGSKSGSLGAISGPPKWLLGLHNSTSVTTVGPLLFASLIRRMDDTIHSNSFIVFDCRSRDIEDKYAKQVVFPNCTSLTSLLPSSKTCTDEDRSRFSEYLKKSVHLRSVFLFSSASAASGLSNSRSFFARAVRYIATCGGTPKEIIMLDRSYDDFCTDAQSVALLKSPIAIYSIVQPTEKTGGLMSCSATSFSAPIDIPKELNISYILNLSTLELPKPTLKALGASASNVGMEHLPLSTDESVSAFYLSCFEKIGSFFVSNKKLNLLIIDISTHQSFSALLCAMVLLRYTDKNLTGVLNIIRRRLSPPDFDAYETAAVQRIAESRSAEGLKSSIRCLIERQKSINRISDEPSSPRKEMSEERRRKRLLDGSLLGAPTVQTKWTNSIAPQLRTLTAKNKQLMTETLSKLFNNILIDSENEKYRTVKSTNPKFHSLVGAHPVGCEIMTLGGWFLEPSGNWTFPKNGDLQRLRDVLVRLN